MSIPKEMMTLADEVEFALRDAGWDIDKASIIATRIAAQDAEIERLRKDAELIDFIERDASYIILDGRKYHPMMIGIDRTAIDAAMRYAKATDAQTEVK